MSKNIQFIVLCFISLYAGLAGAQSPGLNTLELTGQVKDINLLSYLEYYVDTEQSMSFEEISNPANHLDWQSISPSTENINFGYSDDAYWFRLNIYNTTSVPLKPNLVIGYPVLDLVEAFIIRPDQEVELVALGDKRPFHERPIKHRNFIIPIFLNPKETATYYLRVETTSSMQLPLSLQSDRALLEAVEFEMLGLGLYFGTMIVMVLYNLFVFFSVRESNYLYYVFYVASIALFFASLNGISYQYLWPNSTWWNDQSIVFFLASVVFFAALFTIRFLHIRTAVPRLYHIGTLTVVISGALMFASLFFSYATLIGVLIVWAMLAIAFALFAGFYCWLQGDSAAKYYLVAWISLLLGSIVLALNKFHIIDRNVFTENAMQFGSAIEVILLSLALADRLNVEKRRRYEAQIQALENERVARLAQAEALQQEKNARAAQEQALNHEREAREAQSRALDIQRQATENLELTVKSRTRDLEIANKRLEELTYTDGLTGIRNRRFLNQSLEREFSRASREKSPLAILMIDIDHFKQFNDVYGHLAGDDCLRAVAQAITECALRENDVVARYGGEEFCVVLPNTDKTGVLQVGEEIRQAISECSIAQDDQAIKITASVGATSFIPERHHELQRFMNATDVALYRSKANGRNKVSFALPENDK